MLDHIIPYMRIKKEQAIALRNYCYSRLCRASHKSGLTEEEKMTYYYIRDLNGGVV